MRAGAKEFLGTGARNFGYAVAASDANRDSVRHADDTSLEHDMTAHHVRLIRHLSLAFALGAALAGCGGGGGGDGDVNETLGPVRFWSFTAIRSSGLTEDALGPERLQLGGTVADSIDLGRVVLHPRGTSDSARPEVFSNDTGLTYWVSSVAPSAGIRRDDVIGDAAHLQQIQIFRKVSNDASLKLVVSKVILEAIDSNASFLTHEDCPWQDAPIDPSRCARVMWTWLDIDIAATGADGRALVRTGGLAELTGWRSNWDGRAHTRHSSTVPFWGRDDFRIDGDVDGDGGHHAVAGLIDGGRIVIDVPLASVAVGERFSIAIDVKSESINHRQKESYLASSFRDPASGDGLQWIAQGVTPVETPPVKPIAPAPVAAGACPSGPDPAAGVLQFAAPAFAEPEIVGDGATVVITRIGGSRGAVSALLSTRDGTAVAGADYRPVTTQVLFADGESGERAVRIPIIADNVAEPDETLTLVLSDPAGCAALGPLSSATLTIFDDDRPLTPPSSGLDPTFGSAGTVTTQFGGKNTAMALQADGKIVMAGGSIADFLLARYNADGGLDATFGAGGLVTTDIGGFTQEEARAVVVQPDGKIVVAGNVRISEVRGGTLFDEFDFTLVRYNADGSLDTGFGAAGKARSSVLGRAFALALQSDGKIVVAGDDALAAAVSNVKLARFKTDGSLDTSFGALGSVTTDVTPGVDGANNVVMQPDGKIVVSGAFSKSSATGVARYLSNGTPDGSFGTFGSVALDGAFVGDGLALQGDGKLVLVGSKQVGVGTANVTQFELRRLNADGSVDATFGSGGTVNTAFGTSQDAAQSVALQADGKILVSGTANGFRFGLARYNVDGTLDVGFAESGKLTIAFFGLGASAENVAVLPDGKILLGGFASDVRRPGYALARVNP